MGKVKIIIQRCHVMENVNELKVNWRKSLTKKIFSLLQLRTPHQRTVGTGSITNYWIVWIVHTYHPTLMCWLLLFIIVFAYRSNMLSAHSNFWPANESMQSKGYCMGCFYTKKRHYKFILNTLFITYKFTNLHQLAIYFNIPLLI